MANPEFLRAHTLAEFDINKFWGIVTKCLVVVLNVEINIINIKHILLIIVTSYKFMNHRKSQQVIKRNRIKLLSKLQKITHLVWRKK